MIDGDALLHAARVEDRIYSLGGPLSLGSIRDTMWRSQSLCERLFPLFQRNRETKVLVVGGGIAGMVCAVCAVKLGAQVTLVEAANTLAPRQADCKYRSICPTVFDFPFAHWNFGDYPIYGHRAKMPWIRGRATTVHRLWVRHFNHSLRRNQRRIEIFYRAKFDVFQDWQGATNGVKTQFRGTRVIPGQPDEQLDLNRVFDLVIFCPGVGNEKLSIHGSQFRSQAFWDDYDPLFDFDNPMATLPFAEKPVLMVGGGDGGLADFISLLTGRRQFGDVLESINFAPRDLDAIHRIRLTLWSYNQLGGEAVEHRYLTQIQDDSIRLVDDMWKRKLVRDSIAALMRPKETRPFVQLAVRCFHFSFSYVANRIVAQLLARFLAENLEQTNGSIPPFRIGTEVDRIVALDSHVCHGDKLSCSDAWHEVFFKKMLCRSDSCSPSFLDPRTVSAKEIATGSIEQSRQTVTRSDQSMKFRRVLLRIGAGDYQGLTYGVPTPLWERVIEGGPFNFVTPFYPV